jgi:hypothetical protein
MPTRQHLIDDIELRLYASKPSDDIEIEKSHISYLIDIYRNQLVQNKLNDDIKKGLSVSHFYHERELNKTPVKETGVSYDPIFTKYRYYITTEKIPLKLIDNKGLIRINNNYGVNLSPSTDIRQEYLENLPYGGSKLASQVFYLEEQNKIFISPFTESVESLYKYDVLYVPMADANSYLDTDDYPLEDDLIPLLLSLVEDTLIKQMNSAADLENDGTDPYHNK